MHLEGSADDLKCLRIIDRRSMWLGRHI